VNLNSIRIRIVTGRPLASHRRIVVLSPSSPEQSAQVTDNHGERLMLWVSMG